MIDDRICMYINIKPIDTTILGTGRLKMKRLITVEHIKPAIKVF